ncbi:MAG TPA: bifunctional glutamate N-acetyltransferase/amino-acid acetyltransferase ArgJ [Caulobacteraceae bacterium]|jgi:glutamate N-acetyltransferase/amino-acid N-acetyltransferase|nr:bifunctional glutamate N-acetyltransferase/amino-acid acetyltransferase ArgJ [Caulobacteraceae bacterium]
MSAGAYLPVSPLAVAFPPMPAIAGCELSVARAGFYAAERDDLLLMRFAPGTAAAGVFTRHGVGSAPVDWCKDNLSHAHDGVRAMLCNAGCANSFTGKAGYKAAERSARHIARALKCRKREVMLASTGVIGVLLDETKIEPQAAGLATGKASWLDAARAIGTTDTFPKGACAEASIDGRPVRIAGIAKGSGMIAPNMATMLSFVVTDAPIAAGALQALLGPMTERTFNAATVDGDRSTNDTLLLFATGQADAPRVGRATDKRLADFSAKLEAVLLDLALQMVRDGEGASKFVRVEVTGARTPASARRIARSIAESPLVKTAFAGEDANWGRIVMAVGKADEPIDRTRLSVAFGPHCAARKGSVADDYSEAAMSEYMKGAELEVRVDVGVGRASGVIWTCDLTKQYVAINGDYRS